MEHRIKYTLYLMIICILGVILTQGYWLYKDYNYYRGQPLFSADYNFFLRVSALTPTDIPGVVPRSYPIMADTLSSAPSMVAYPVGQPIMSIPSSPANMNTLSIAKTIAVKGVPAQMLPSVTPIAPLTAFYKAIPYKAPLSYVLQKMKLQFGVSILLICFTTSCFVFMSVTIFRQRKLSIAKNDFINNMTHELKTPLATVSVAVEAMRNFGAWDDQRKAQLYLNISKNEIDHLSTLIELILQQSIFESHKMEIALKLTDVNEMVREITDNYFLSNMNITITRDCMQNIPHLLIDPTHMGNVIRNLIDNAIKYSGTQKIIAVSSKIEENYWKLTVSDNGIGIPKIYHKDIFEKFFRVPNGFINPVKGFGLGLFYIKQVVSLHKGTISVQSNEDQGSTFTISIPLNH